MKRKVLVSLVAALALLAMGVVAAQASTTIINTIDDFATENLKFNGTAPIIENFENDKINTPGLTITAVGVDHTVYKLGYYENTVDVDTGSYQVVSYSSALHGFGAWFDLFNPAGPGTSLDIYIGTDPTTGTFVGNIPNSYAGEFWGFSSTDPFTSVVIADGNTNTTLYRQETYQMVDMALCSAVPLPPSALLLGTGLLGLVVGLRRFRKG